MAEFEQPQETGDPAERNAEPLARAAARFGLTPADLVNVVGTDEQAEPLAEDDAEHAVDRRIARVDVEESFATVYLTFEDGSYLTFAARIDEEGVILLDRFCPPARSYEEYWVFDELEGESGPPPPEHAPAPGTPFHPAAWKRAAGRTIAGLGWYEDGMQAFVHMDEGGYLTLAARAAGGVAYLLGYFSPDDPAEPDGYMVFD
ncbi:MAG TPA: hypothetical protein VFA70_13140 [Dehalococcoidia bacterium]|nr:hypothetical protein [Dehalococcoidia bacterium]